MDENEPKDTNANEPTGAPVVDIQPPKNETDAPFSQPDLSDPLGDEGSDTQSTETVAEQQSDTPKPDENAADDKPPTDSLAAETGAPNPIERPELPAPKKHNGPVLMIVIAILVAAILAMVAIMALTRKDDKSTTQTPAPAETQTPVQQLVDEQVGETAGAIDDALANIDETKDFPDDEISDGTLGL